MDSLRAGAARPSSHRTGFVVARPGSDDAPEATGTPAGGALLCVGVVAPHKGQDVLIEALAALGADPAWTCTIAGSLDAFPDYADRVATLAAAAGISDRVTLTGALAEDDLDRAYQRADLVVAPSRVESYGMAIADALRRGIPVVASRVGGIPQTVESRAAVLVPPGQPQALADALRRWIVGAGPAEAVEGCGAARQGEPPALERHRRPDRIDAGGCAMSDVIPVSVEWLSLREEADARSRSRTLARKAARMTRTPVVVHDLGSGTGSMMRWLAPLLPGPQTWVLHDWNHALLDHAAQRASDSTGQPATVHTSVRDVGQLRDSDLAGASLDHDVGAARCAHPRGDGNHRPRMCAGAEPPRCSR